LARSRPFVCYWTGDGHFSLIDVYPDVLVGAGDGKVRLYRGVPIVGDFDEDSEVDFKSGRMKAKGLLQFNRKSFKHTQ
jgi:hypothetical protein